MPSRTVAADLREDIERFREDGFIVVKGLFGGDELRLLQKEAQAQIDAGDSRGPRQHYGRGVDAGGREVLFRIDAVIQKAIRNDSALTALGHPAVLRRAAALVGEPFVCWSDALLWKGPAGGAEVPLHSARGWKDPSIDFENLVVDVYLDHADQSNGCLKVLPGSHRLDDEAHLALLDMNLEAPGLVDVVLEPGDVLFHSEWMLHGSAATADLGRATRRILYLAFRRPDVFAPAGATPRQRRYVAAGLRRMQVAQRRRASKPYAAGEAPFGLVVPPEWAADVAAATDEQVAAVGYFGDAVATGD